MREKLPATSSKIYIHHTRLLYVVTVIAKNDGSVNRGTSAAQAILPEREEGVEEECRCLRRSSRA